MIAILLSVLLQEDALLKADICKMCQSREEEDDRSYAKVCRCVNRNAVGRIMGSGIRLIDAFPIA